MHLDARPPARVIAWRMTVVLGTMVLLCLGAGQGAAGSGKPPRQVIHFEPLAGPITNPLMGWAPWATIRESKQPHTLVYADLTWREFEPVQGQYDFAAFEKKNQLARWRAEGKRVVFRFVADRPGRTDHRDIPDWMVEAAGGDAYSTPYGKGFSPDYANPIVTEAHANAIHALGERYGADGFFAYIEIGSLGHWGEWHVHTGSGVRPLPPGAVRDQYVQHYIDAFPNTHLLMRRPFAIAARNGLGLFNDMTGDPSQTAAWLEWIAEGGAYDQTGEPDTLSPMPDAWKTAPIGGEQTTTTPAEELYGPLLDQTIRLLEESHATFVGPHGPYAVDPSSPIQPGIDRALARLGYRLAIRQVEMPYWVAYGQEIDVTVSFVNDGVAPVYENFPARFFLIDEGGTVRKTYAPDLDLTAILPGEPAVQTFRLAAGRLANGRYTLAFAILDPLTMQPAVQLAITNPRGDLIYALGRVEIAGYRGLERE